MTPAESRARTLVEFRARAVEIFRAQPEMRSVMLAVAQYWNDQADDEVHALLVASPRELPVWPHACLGEWDDDPLFSTAGELCAICGELGWLAIDVQAFARFCHEHGSQEHEGSESYLPYAIARRGAGDELALEVIGKLVRPAEDMIPDEPEPAAQWLALPRAAALYDLVGASPADDGPRRVLADYLLEQEHPRGELIALALADRLDAAAIARRDELLARYGRQWISPLGAVVPETGAHWERGFLARADVFVDGNAAAVRGAAAWRTVEVLRCLGTEDFVDLEMVALRDVGPLYNGLVELAAAPRPWAIERLVADLCDGELVDALWSATTLPRLTHLVLRGRHIADALDRTRPAWWPQLARLTVQLDRGAPESFAAWLAKYAGIAPRVAISGLSEVTGDPGWELASGSGGQLEISLAGWHEAATSRALVDIIKELPSDAEVALVPSPYWTPLAEDAARIAEEAERPVRVAGSR